MSQDWPAQIGQDKWVAELFQNKRDGTFLDLGAHQARHVSNTWALEKNFGWRGIAVDNDPQWIREWAEQRPGSVFVLGDACTLDYPALLAAQHIPQPVDYLSLDLEPPELTWKCLQHILGQKIWANTVTFETDYYRYKESREPSRALMASLGYVLARPGVPGHYGEQDDFYIHKMVLT